MLSALIPERRSLSALVSIHDVMPRFLPEVSTIVSLLTRRGIATVQLLVVPGLDWTSAQVATLRRWQDAGHSLAGHGWSHRARTIRGVRHRVHSLVLSRDAAEHLALDAEAIVALIHRCHDWFAANGLAAPDLYVPPAWAMGAISRSALRRLPFRSYELLSGVLDARSQRLVRLPLVGFEADTAWRARALRCWNALNLGLARRRHAPLRVAIHPRDLGLLLAGDLRALIADLGPSAGPLRAAVMEQWVDE